MEYDGAVLVLRKFVGPEECALLEAWALRAVSEGRFVDGISKGERVAFRVTNRICPDRIEYPPTVYAVQKRVAAVLGLSGRPVLDRDASGQRHGRDGVVCSVTYGGGDVYEHTDPGVGRRARRAPVQRPGPCPGRGRHGAGVGRAVPGRGRRPDVLPGDRAGAPGGRVPRRPPHHVHVRLVRPRGGLSRGRRAPSLDRPRCPVPPRPGQRRVRHGPRAVRGRERAGAPEARAHRAVSGAVVAGPFPYTRPSHPAPFGGGCSLCAIGRS
ncbi:hypothetical protein FTUN_6301 [Frigoriglobus tundricola]|uniref:Uncharacterized protein n=1 Tax=Frigoriglobus tundricola TaxID=2774151 RepID=A0A6M5YZ25_9BACT|nr:hypothetical protein FTUN_6301 [Frigoriglobus tundricola]